VGLRWLIADVMPSDPPKSLTQKAWVYNDGTGDMGESPTQFLLVRNLDTMLQEETIAKGLAKLDVIPKRVLLIRDRKTKVSWGFAFIEYQDVSVSPATKRTNGTYLEYSTHNRHWADITTINRLKSRNQR
jgi:RNA recognition motif. (a.k.a. RRM, RBD, or RNP domain)